MQVVVSQWAVVIQVLEFHNPMNIETRMSANGGMQYCCCDTVNCAPQPFFGMNDYDCAAECDIFFVVSLHDGNAQLSSISTFQETILNSASHSLHVGYTLPFTLNVFPILVRYAKF